MSEFALYPEERHWWSFSDYRTVRDITRRLVAEKAMRSRAPFTAVEFGPGSSTLSLMEGGATSIESFEDDDDWRQVYRERLEALFSGVVSIRPYVWSDPLDIPAPAEPFDLALVDGPRDTLKRPAVIRWCLQHARAVLVPTEEAGLRPILEALAAAFACQPEWMVTGPLAGGFVLLVPGSLPAQPTDQAPIVATGASDAGPEEPPQPSSVPPTREPPEGDATERPLSRRERRKAAKAQKAGG